MFWSRDTMGQEASQNPKTHEQEQQSGEGIAPLPDTSGNNRLTVVRASSQPLAEKEQREPHEERRQPGWPCHRQSPNQLGCFWLTQNAVTAMLTPGGDPPISE